MKRFLIFIAVAAILVAAVVYSRKLLAPTPGVEAVVERRNPWTSLDLNNSPDLLRFAVVSDRTGGHRAGIFSRAVEQLNLLQPEFVLSVGDLVEGTNDEAKAREQWQEFENH